MGKHTINSLLASLLKLVELCDIHYVELDKDIDAYTEWPPVNRIQIYIDPSRIGVIQGVIHELLHVTLNKELSPLGTQLEELAVKKYTEKLWLTMRNKDVPVWREAINRKVVV